MNNISLKVSKCKDKEELLNILYKYIEDGNKNELMEDIIGEFFKYFTYEELKEFLEHYFRMRE